LVGGSTYHSILGINDKNTSTISMAKLRTRLDGVNYYESLNVNLRLVPLTEVSMSNSDA